jgi:prepilin-type N-terminal cleavage/methylation domain-containing protein
MGLSIVLLNNPGMATHQQRASHTTPTFGKRGGRGFTAIELITVIVLIGIVSVVAIPRIQNTKEFSERAFHDSLRSAIDYARKSAVAGRRYVCAVLTPGALGSGKIELFIDANLLPETPGGNVDCASTRLRLPTGDSLAAPRDVDLTTGVGILTIVFSPLGEPQSLARVPLTSRQQISIGAQSLVVEPWTGLVH